MKCTHVFQGRNAWANVEKSQAPAKTFVDLETIAVGKGLAGQMEAVMERLEEQADMSVLPNQQVSPPPTTTNIVSKVI